MRTLLTLFLTLTISLGAACSAHAVLVQSIAGGTAATTGSPVFVVGQSTQQGGWIDALNGGTGETRYIAFDWTINNNNGGQFFGGLTFFQNESTGNLGAERLLVGAGFGDTHYGAGEGGTIEPTTGTIDYVIGETVRIGLRLTTTNSNGITGGDDSWAMWVNPLLSEEGTPYAERNDWTINTFAGVYSRAGNGSGSATISNFVVGTTFADIAAIPEVSPTMIGSLLTGIGLAFRSRRGLNASKS